MLSLVDLNLELYCNIRWTVMIIQQRWEFVRCKVLVRQLHLAGHLVLCSLWEISSCFVSPTKSNVFPSFLFPFLMVQYILEPVFNNVEISTIYWNSERTHKYMEVHCSSSLLSTFWCCCFDLVPESDLADFWVQTINQGGKSIVAAIFFLCSCVLKNKFLK